MLSILEPGVARPNFTPRSYTRLNSTYLQQECDTWLSSWFSEFNVSRHTGQRSTGTSGMLTFLV